MICFAVTIKAKPGNAGAVFKGFVVRAKRTIGDTDELLGTSFILIKQINPEKLYIGIYLRTASKCNIYETKFIGLSGCKSSAFFI